MTAIQTKSIHHFALSVEDVSAMIAWYGDHFGFSLERSFSPDNGETQIAHIATPQGVRIELLHVPDQRDSLDLGLDAFGAIANRGAKHIGLEVDNIELAYRQAVDRGLTVIQSVVEVRPAGVKNMWLIDREGNQIELLERL